MALPTTDAYYHIFSAVQGDGSPESMFCTDVVGAGKSDYTKVQVYSPHYGQNQVVWVGYKSGNVYYLWDDNSAKWLTTYTSKAADGENICIWNTRDGNWARWYFQEVGTATINGSTYPTYYIRALGSSSGRVLTAPAGSSGLITLRPVGYPDGAKGRKATTPSPRQLWMLIPTTEGANSYTVPSAGGGATSKVSSTATTITANSGSLYPSWSGDRAVNQIRYKKRTRPIGGSMGAWSNWLNIITGSNYNLGWGSPPTASITSTKSGNRRISNTAITMENLGSTYERADYWIQVREYDTGKKWHGRRYGYYINQVKPPTVDTVTAAWTPDGLAVNWTMSYVGSGATVTVESTDGLFSRQTEVGTDGNDGLVVPNSALKRTVMPGDTVKLKVSVKTDVGATASRSATTTAQGAGTSGSMTLTSTVSGTTATVTASQSGAKAWLVVPRGHGNRYIRLPGSSPWKVIPPLGVPWKVYASYESNGTYYAKEQQFAAITETPPTYHITSQDGNHDLAIAYKTDNPGPDFYPTYTRSQSEAETFGRERPVRSYGNTTSAEWTITGDLIGGDQLGEVDWFAHVSHVWFRSPNGFIAQCGMDSLGIDLSSTSSHEVSVSLKEEVW